MHGLEEKTTIRSISLDSFNPFSLPQIRDFVQVYSYCKRTKISIESVLKKYDTWLKQLQKTIEDDPWMKESIILNKEAITYCPKCDKPLDLLDIHNLKGKNNLFSWKSVLSCRYCGYEEFSEEDYQIRAKRRLERIALKQHEIEVNKVLVGRKIEIVCPKCKKEVVIQTINIPKGKNNIYGWRSVIKCVDCTYENFSKLKANQRMRKINRSRRII